MKSRRIGFKIEYIKDKVSALYNMVVYNMLIRFMLESYLDYSLIVLINLQKLRFNLAGEAVASALTITLLVVLIPFPLFLYLAA